MRKYFAKRPLRQRVIAIAAAYAIALSSLLASFGLARAAAEAAAAPGGIICHTLVAGDEAPSPADRNGGNHCADNCCAGCLMMLAALPPPPVTGVVAVLPIGQAVVAAPGIVLIGGAPNKDHRSRAPPLPA